MGVLSGALRGAVEYQVMPVPSAAPEEGVAAKRIVTRWSNVLLWRVQLAVSYSLSSGGGATT